MMMKSGFCVACGISICHSKSRLPDRIKVTAPRCQGRSNAQTSVALARNLHQFDITNKHGPVHHRSLSLLERKTKNVVSCKNPTGGLKNAPSLHRLNASNWFFFSCDHLWVAAPSLPQRSLSCPSCFRPTKILFGKMLI